MGVRRALKALGENTMTKLMPSVCHSTRRKLAIFAEMSRPSTLTDGVADLEVEPVGELVSTTPAGGPL